MFNQTVYTVDENNGPVQPVLVLDTPVSFNFRVQVREYSGSASSKSRHMYTYVTAQMQLDAYMWVTV